MSQRSGFATSLVLFIVGYLGCGGATAAGQSIERRLPPAGIDVDAEQRDGLQRELARLQIEASRVADHPLIADVTCLLKAVDLALRHGEFYRNEDIEKANNTLQLAAERLVELGQGGASWTKAHGLVVRGYTSTIDGSPQPYGLVIPKEMDLSQDNRLYVWLHGRGDKTTDLHFIDQRRKSAGQVTPDDAIVLHPFGRQCIGYKSAGEIDVLESIEHVAKQYGIDRDRIVLMGFSMGGAGVWHLGAHYADRWVAMSPGAGFAETAQYNRLKVADYPAWYERELWKLYDAPNYVRNLFNIPVVAYSGENDKQIQAARVMEAAYASHGRELSHLIGPGMGHRYHPEVLAEITRRMKAAADHGRNPLPKRVFLQTCTLRYNRQYWVEVTRLREHWQDSRVDAEVLDDQSIRLQTENVAALTLRYWKKVPADARVIIDKQELSLRALAGSDRIDLAWRGQWVPQSLDENALAKRPGQQGPIDDVFLTPFLVVLPDGNETNAARRQWLEFEVQHLRDRWPALFRGELPVKSAAQLSKDDLRTKSLVLWGTPATNAVIRRAVSEAEGNIPLAWTEAGFSIDGQPFEGDHLMPTLIYPSPWAAGRYVVLNSGPTFREGHDRTNSLQNPKLPDWAVIDIRRSPSATAPGGIHDAGFFDEHWRRK